MGGKSRKTGTPSKILIQRIKAGLAPIRHKKKWDAECDEIIEKMGDKILDSIKQNCEDWNNNLANSIPKGGE